MNETVQKRLGILGVVVGVFVALGIGLVSFYKTPILMNNAGETARELMDVAIEKTYGLIDEDWRSGRVMVNDESAISGQQQWPYYFYATILDVEQPYYGSSERPAINEWVLYIETFSKKEIFLHALHAKEAEGVEHPVLGAGTTFGLMTENVEDQYKVGDVIKVFIDEPSIEKAIDEAFVPLAVFVEKRV